MSGNPQQKEVRLGPLQLADIYKQRILPLGRGVHLMDPLATGRTQVDSESLGLLMEQSGILLGQSAANVTAVATSANSSQLRTFLDYLQHKGKANLLQSDTLVFLLRCCTLTQRDKEWLVREFVAVRSKEVKASVTSGCRDTDMAALLAEISG